MKNQDLKEKISKLPENPGVYFFVDKDGLILYIGKATNLKDRVKSYFSNDILETRGPKILKMIELANEIKFQKTDSVLEAILLENYLIKKHQPTYNTKEKDDKSYNFVIITKEDFPRVLLVRGKDIMSRTVLDTSTILGVGEVGESFGPFPSGTSIREGLRIIRKIFPYRDKCLPFEENKNQKNIRPCFNRQIGLCPGVCSGEISKSDYLKNIKNISRFFKGQKKEILKDLEREMKRLSKIQEFEKAGLVKKQIFAINHIQDISLLKQKTETFPRGDTSGKHKSGFRIESYDISHTSGSSVVGVMIVLEDGKLNKSEYRKFNIKNNPNNNDLKSLQEVLERRLKHSEWQMPNLIVVDGGENQKKLFETTIKQNNLEIPVVSVVKDDKHIQREILGNSLFLKYKDQILISNIEAHRFAIGFHRQKRNKLV